MDRTACTEPQCLYKGALYLFTYTKTNVHSWPYLFHFFLEWEMFQTKVVEKHIFCWIFFFEYCTVYEIMWKHILQPGRSQMTIWPMCIACWWIKATNTRSKYAILIAFPLQHLQRGRPQEQIRRNIARRLRHDKFSSYNLKNFFFFSSKVT